MKSYNIHGGNRHNGEWRHILWYCICAHTPQICCKHGSFPSLPVKARDGERGRKGEKVHCNCKGGGVGNYLRSEKRDGGGRGGGGGGGGGGNKRVKIECSFVFG